MRSALLLGLCAGASLSAQSVPEVEAVTVPGRTEARITGAAPDAMVALVLGIEHGTLMLPGGALLGLVPTSMPDVGVADALGHCLLTDHFPTFAGRGLSFLTQAVVLDAMQPGAGALQVTPVRALRSPPLDQEVDLVVLFGQSNAEGGALRAELPERLVGPLPRARVWNDAALEWQALEAGANNTFFPMAQWVGPEMGIADAMAGAERPVWLIKLALFQATLGPSPGPWNEWGAHAGEIYPELLRRIEAAAAAAQALGLRPCVRLVCMMQGESDALDPLLGAVYGRHLQELVLQLRRDLAGRGLDGGRVVPFRIGLVSSSLAPLGFPAVAAVRAAQQHTAEIVPRCAVIETAALPVGPDGVHFSMPGTLALGRAFLAQPAW